MTADKGVHFWSLLAGSLDFFFPWKPVIQRYSWHRDPRIPWRPRRGEEGLGSSRTDLLSPTGRAVSLAWGWDLRDIVSREKRGLMFSLTFLHLEGEQNGSWLLTPHLLGLGTVRKVQRCLWWEWGKWGRFTAGLHIKPSYQRRAAVWQEM